LVDRGDAFTPWCELNLNHTTAVGLIDRLNDRSARVGVVGLGYVGLPLAMAFADAGFCVAGIDLSPEKVDAVNSGRSYVLDVPSEHLNELVQAGKLRATTDYSVLRECDAVSLCVPTPLNKTGDPDVSYIVDATENVAKHVHPGMVFVLESTTYPGTTSEVVLPLLTANSDGLRVGESFFLAFSPERIDPGRTDWDVRSTPRVVGGITPACLEVATAYYGQIISNIVPVSSTEAAEMVKLLENTFRAINIGLANEALLMCDKLGLDVWEVIEAASTKPFGFMKFSPGPGLGGHCIPIDPLYLSWRLKGLRYNARFIELASEINTGMPPYWVQKVQDALNEVEKSIKGSDVLVLGVSYKKDIDDVRESPAIDIIELLMAKGAHVTYHDPHVPRLRAESLDMYRVSNLDIALSKSDCVVVVTDHSAYDWAAVRDASQLVVDTRHVIH
jgi:UDP-N-acetyl-D-glucosamine dehydrogenase